MTWRDRSNVGACARFVGVHESAQEILVVADHLYVAVAGHIDRPVTRISGGSVHLHFVLTAVQK